jgi:hypothetical protein
MSYVPSNNNTSVGYKNYAVYSIIMRCVSSIVFICFFMVGGAAKNSVVGWMKRIMTNVDFDVIKKQVVEELAPRISGFAAAIYGGLDGLAHHDNNCATSNSGALEGLAPQNYTEDDDGLEKK